MRRFASILLFTLATLAATSAYALPECEDGIDNDGDGLIDYPADPGCTSPSGTSELNSPLDASVPDLAPGDAAQPNPFVTADGGTAGVVVSPGGGGGQLPARERGCSLAPQDPHTRDGLLVVLGLVALAAVLRRRPLHRA